MLKVNYDDLEYDFDQALYKYAGELFTGIAYGYHADDSIITEFHFVNGLKHGTSKSWYPSGKLEYEYQFDTGGGHGVSRDWDEDGTLRREQIIEFGIVLEEQEYNGRGELKEHFMLQETDSLYNILLMRRERWKDE